MSIIVWLPWLLSVLTIYGVIETGNKRLRAWVICLVNQALWLVWICASGTWGMIPMNVALWIVAARNLRRWHREAVEAVS